MEEKILNTRKNGMAMLLLTLLGYVVSIALFIFCITLCVATVLQGTKITDSKLITSLQIDERTFQKTTDQTQGYQFTTTDGIEFQISDEELLDTVVPSKPQTVEIYQCNTYDGFSWCYISKSNGVYYKIK